MVNPEKVHGLLRNLQSALEQLRQMAGLRYRLVHLYWEIDDELVYQYIQDNLIDFDEFIQKVLEFLKRATAI